MHRVTKGDLKYCQEQKKAHIRERHRGGREEKQAIRGIRKGATL